MIYLDNASTSLKKPPAVSQAILSAIQTLGNTARGAHGYSLDAASAIYDAREKLAAIRPGNLGQASRDLRRAVVG